MVGLPHLFCHTSPPLCAHAVLQRYGLQVAFSEIERLSHEVTSSGNPIEMDLRTRYVVKGLNKEQTVDSKVTIHTDGDKISRVEDKWSGSIEEGGIKNVSSPAIRLLGLRGLIVLRRQLIIEMNRLSAV